MGLCIQQPCSWFCLQPVHAHTSLCAKAEDAESQYCFAGGAQVMYQIFCHKLLPDPLLNLDEVCLSSLLSEVFGEKCTLFKST